MRPTAVRTKVERFLPYRYAKSGVVLDLTRALADGDPIEVDAEARTVDLSGREFEAAELELSATLAPGTIESCFPESERESPPGRLALCIRCPATRLRRSSLAPLSAAAPSSFAVHLSRQDLRGLVELVPFLVRTRSGLQGDYAAARGERLAGGRPWSLRADRERRVEGQFLDIRFEDFEKLPAVPADIVYHLDLDQPSPILWLNARHKGVAEVLMSRATRGARASVRDVVFDMITQGVWAQLFVRAASDLTRAGETSYSWEDQVLSMWLPKILPAVSDQETRLHVLTEETSRGELPTLLGALDRAVQEDSSLATHLARMVEAED